MKGPSQRGRQYFSRMRAPIHHPNQREMAVLRSRSQSMGFSSMHALHGPVCHQPAWCGKQGQSWVKDKKEGQCQQRSGCRASVAVTAARAQRAAERDEDGHWIGFGHIPEALHHTPRMVVFAHRPTRPSWTCAFCCICFPPKKNYSSALSQPCHPHQGELLPPPWARGSQECGVPKHQALHTDSLESGLGLHSMCLTSPCT